MADLKDEDERLYRMPARARYHQDSEFHHLVDMMHMLIQRSQFSPSELREAALLAAVMYEETRVTRFHIEGELMRLEKL